MYLTGRLLRKSFIITALAIASCSFGQRGDTLVFCKSNGGSYNFGWMNIPTEVVNVTSSGTLTGAQQGQTSYDRINNRYFMKGFGISVVNSISGLVINTVVNVTGMNNFEYDELCNCLVGPDAQNNGIFTQVDIATSVKTVVGSAPITGMVMGESTFDRINRVYYFCGLSGINSINSQGVLSNSGNTTLRGIEYDATLGRFFGMCYLNNQWLFGSFDPATQLTTTLGVVANTTYYAGETTYDEANHRYFVQTTQGIFVMDALTGNLIKNISGNVLRGIEYASFVENTEPEDPIDTGIGNIEGPASLSIGPNPSCGVFTLSGFQNATLEVTDPGGRSVFSADVVGPNYFLDLSGQEKGVYFLRAKTSAGTQKLYKLMVE